MSDSLRGMVPELEDERLDEIEDSFVIVALALDTEDIPVIAGSLVGISHEMTSIKLDMRLPIQSSYTFFKSCMTSEAVCKICHLSYMNENIDLKGPFLISSPRIVDFDRQNKMCTLGVDLIKS